MQHYNLIKFFNVSDKDKYESANQNIKYYLDIVNKYSLIFKIVYIFK